MERQPSKGLDRGKDVKKNRQYAFLLSRRRRRSIGLPITAIPYPTEPKEFRPKFGDVTSLKTPRKRSVAKRRLKMHVVTATNNFLHDKQQFFLPGMSGLELFVNGKLLTVLTVPNNTSILNTIVIFLMKKKTIAHLLLDF